jgi:hypothetical protein
VKGKTAVPFIHSIASPCDTHRYITLTREGRDGGLDGKVARIARDDEEVHGAARVREHVLGQAVEPVQGQEALALVGVDLGQGRKRREDAKE